MKFISKEIVNGRPVITCESKFLWFRKQRKFLAESRLAGDYFRWLEIPNHNVVPDALSFQLDAWNSVNQA